MCIDVREPHTFHGDKFNVKRATRDPPMKRTGFERKTRFGRLLRRNRDFPPPPAVRSGALGGDGAGTRVFHFSTCTRSPDLAEGRIEAIVPGAFLPNVRAPYVRYEFTSPRARVSVRKTSEKKLFTKLAPGKKNVSVCSSIDLRRRRSTSHFHYRRIFRWKRVEPGRST